MQDYNKLILLIENSSDENPFNLECVAGMKKEKLIFHSLGNFERMKVLNILYDKVKLSNLNIVPQNIQGIESLIIKLENYKIPIITQYSLSMSLGSYLIITSVDLSILIGIGKWANLDYEQDFKNQERLIKAGYPNKNNWIFDNGKMIRSI